jgi:tellurite resistance protein TerB
MFGALKRAFKGATREVAAEYGQNKDFLEAVAAAVALVAAADGDIEDTEKRSAIRIIGNNPTLSKLYKTQDIEQTLETMFKRAKDASGRVQLARELDDIKSKENSASMSEDVYLTALDIASADGEVDEKELAVLSKIANRLGVDTSKFDF